VVSGDTADPEERRDGPVRVAVGLGVNDTIPEGMKQVGSPGYGGPIVTAGGLVFIGATRDRCFRAFDSRTGKELWSTQFDYNVTAIPITYLGRNGQQYVAVTAATNATTNHCRCSRFLLCARLDRISIRRSAQDSSLRGDSRRVGSSPALRMVEQRNRRYGAP
jgi:outer membrane protein assembly factor BamB